MKKFIISAAISVLLLCGNVISAENDEEFPLTDKIIIRDYTWEKPGILKSQEYTGPIHDLPLDYCLEIKTEEALLISGSAEMMQRIRELAEKKAQKEAQNKGKND